jgi:hypothetical protein
MALPEIHPMNVLWLVGDPSEMRELLPTIQDLFWRALKGEGGDVNRHAVIIGAIENSSGPSVFDTEVIEPRSDAIELRPMFNTLYLICGEITDLISEGPPQNPEQQREVHLRARKVMQDRGGSPRGAHLMADSAVAAIHLSNEDLITATLYPDGRLLLVKTGLLHKVFLEYLERRHSR